MADEVLVIDDSLLFLRRAGRGEVEDGTVAIRIGLPTGDVHSIAVPPHVANYVVRDDELLVLAGDQQEPVRRYRTWLWVDEAPHRAPQMRAPARLI